MLLYARPLARLIGELEKLPGIGPKSAQRMAYFLLRCPRPQAEALAAAILEVRDKIQFCRECFNFAEGEMCEICRDPRRDPRVICVVAEARDILAIERTSEFRGLYHVLQGLVSPQEGIMPEMLRLRELMERVSRLGTEEVIVATNPTVEGDITALQLANELKPLGVHVTRLALGLPVGAELDYADQATLSSALQFRREL